MKTQKKKSVIILAGGKSVRMGYPKPWLKKNNDTTFLVEIVSTFKNFGVDDIVVVLNDKLMTKEWENQLIRVKQNALVIKNHVPEKGRLYSLQLGLKATKYDTLFIHNVDNPFIENEVLEQLSNKVETRGVTIPSYQGRGGHPVIISKTVKNEIINNYQNHTTLKEIFTCFTKTYIDVNSNSILKNINTPQDLAKAKYEFA